MTIDEDRVYVTCADGTVVAMNLTDGSIAWSRAKTNLAINSAPVKIGTAVYAGSTDGNLYAFDGATGNDLWQLNAGSAIITDLITEDGAIYFATQGNGAELPPTFFSIDAASQGNDVLIYPVPDADTILFDQGQSNGVVYFYSKQNVYAVNMDMILHEFNVDTKLTVEDYDTSTSNPTSNDTSYRITLALNDPLKVPRVNQAVKVWASDTVYLSNLLDGSGKPTVIGPATPLWVQTDGSGQVSLAVSAYDDGSHGGTGSSTTAPLVNCPAIFAWANFMMPGEAIVIYPDHEHLGNLSNVQGNNTMGIARTYAVQSTLYLDQATTYDGSKLVSSGYQDSTSLTNIATIMRNAIGTRNTPSNSAGVQGNAPALAASAGGKYIAYAASMPQVNYSSDNTQPTTRPFVPGSDPVFTMDISGASGVPTSYQPAYDDSRPSNLPPPSTVVTASATGRYFVAGVGEVESITSIKDFFHKVVKGVEKVAKVAWKFAVNAVNTVIHTAESVYNLVITSVEDAVTVVAGFLKSVVADIKKAIEWLSALFDFKNIIVNHNALKAQVLGALNALLTWAGQQVTAIANNQSNDVDTTFGALSGKGQSSMSLTGQGVAGQTVQSQQGQNSDPNAIYNTGGNNNATQCKFMHHKAMEGKSALASTRPESPYRLYLPWLSVQSSASQPSSLSATTTHAVTAPDPDTITSAFDTFITSLLTTIKNDFEDFPDQLKAKISSIQSKMSSSKSVLSNGLADILAVFEVLADDLINIAKSIAKDFLILCNTLVSQLIAWLATPLNIPFISRLYKSVSGNDLTFLDLYMLVVAVPSTILLYVITGYPTVPASVEAKAQADAAGIAHAGKVDPAKVGQTFLAIGAIIVNAVAALVDAWAFAASATADGDPNLTAFNRMDLIVDTITWGLNSVWSRSWSQWESKDWIFWAVQAWPQLVNLVYSFRDSTINFQVGRDVTYGVALLAMQSVYAALWPGNYRDATDKAKGLVISANVFSSLAWIVEAAHAGGNTGDLIAGACKLAFGEVAAILGFTASLIIIFPPSAQQAHPGLKPALSFA